MTLQVDLEKLRAMSKALHALSGEASRLKATDSVPIDALFPIGFETKHGFGFRDPVLASVYEARRLAFGVQDSLITGVSRRLGEIGELMHAVTVEFRKAEDTNAATLAATYTKASGNWGS
ncbi:hypothetical protein [Nocardia nepalensis]|uniref:hypothetical protein n=1 Tax=Nocardia nepalensis TaxID=3375448 RepID=UPI003B6782E9